MSILGVGYIIGTLFGRKFWILLLIWSSVWTRIILVCACDFFTVILFLKIFLSLPIIVLVWLRVSWQDLIETIGIEKRPKVFFGYHGCVN